MGGYDLYGRYYPNSNDAINAEMAQCAQIDADILRREIDQLKLSKHNESEMEYYAEMERQHNEEMRIQSIENRLSLIEKRLNYKRIIISR